MDELLGHITSPKSIVRRVVKSPCRPHQVRRVAPNKFHNCLPSFSSIYVSTEQWRLVTTVPSKTSSKLQAPSHTASSVWLSDAASSSPCQAHLDHVWIPPRFHLFGVFIAGDMRRLTTGCPSDYTYQIITAAGIAMPSTISHTPFAPIPRVTTTPHRYIKRYL